ncbi:baseplate multidomain protein megatron [Ancylobacter oerskovii]|uniref:Glycoside hydrolase TIM-barrel-like domain-containing protein n=1 Tax=Ancylobacter oerskovii TaxID=459519 RepID=A0ABW4YXH6_9HYPH|nr:glycoside hydrolase/phage tail family protein [Ancylobacter oerskovii]MBS7541997.1 glycoside hydrolase/phage tail family protein [Ancylobacter oerskovii]
MATLLLGGAGAALGGSLFGPLGAIAGRAIGALGGAVIDRALLTPGKNVEGPRLADLDIMTSVDGAPMPRLYGRARLSAQLIWASEVEEVVSTQTGSAGGKGSSLGGGTTTTTYSYYANFAVGLCEGPATWIGRIWADGRELDLEGLNVRTYLGGEDQMPDPLVAALEGEGAPAYRGLVYLVFERLPLADFGNRLPQLSVEVERAVGALEPRLKAVTMIPAATEFGYDTTELKRVERAGSYAAENRHATIAATDVEASLDRLMACCPNLERVALVVSWFGTDLRAGRCEVHPGVERRDKTVKAGGTTQAWRVAGRTRADAHLVSAHEGRPAYGGTPSDASVVRAIQALKARGLKVTLYPFIMMDVPAGSGLADPWTGNADQPAYPWRGRITCDPAPGRPGTPDGTAGAGAQIAALFGTATAAQFAISGGEVIYAGPADWGLRRMALHYARLSVLAGGVEALLIGSEMAALTRVRSSPGVYPAAQHYAALAAEVKATVGAGTLVSYAADWTEYGAHSLDGGEEVRFPLDPLWASPAIDFIGIDWYAPIADWRDGDVHLDAASFGSGYDPAYLAANVAGGEGFDWYYADEDARATQARTPITDGAYGEPWVFRQKDIASWWGHAHHERIGGVRQAGPTAYVPGAKPVRLTEIGCAAVDKGANRPSVFPDPKSVENGLPPFSNGQRDDLIQRRHLEASFDALASDAANPPAAGLPGGRMIDLAGVYAWTWDARPFPAFPLATDVWADGTNWTTGHWLTGRLGSAPLAEMCAALAADAGIEGLDASRLAGVIDGYVVDRPMSVRAALEPLGRVFGFDLMENGDGLALRPRGGRLAAELADEDVLADEDRPAPSVTRASEGELPLSVTIGFVDAMAEYRRSTAASRRLAGAARVETSLDVAMAAHDGLVSGLAEMWLQDAWATRESLRFALPPSRLALEPGDIVGLTRDGRRRLVEITEVSDTEAREVTGRSIDPGVFALAVREPRATGVTLPVAAGPPELAVLTLPALPSSGEAPTLAWLAAFTSPWPGALAVWRGIDGASFERVATLPAPSVMGRLTGPLAPGAPWLWQPGARLTVELYGGLLAAASEEAVLNGANLAALVAPDGAVEVIQFAEAELVGQRVWSLGTLLRGQGGTEARAAAEWPAGTLFVRLDRNLAGVATGAEQIGRALTLRAGRADRDHGDPAVSETGTTVGALALAPLAPVHARARRTPAGVEMSWTRRTRQGGDNWDVVEVPLGEAAEAYRVEILNGAAVVRTATVTSPAFLYAAAAEIVDFGAAQPFIDLRVAQLSASAGAGAPLLARLAT